ncbi:MULTISPECIES: amino acid ABC transporter permease [Clostridium]|jgi:putative amino-acid transport system permease protein|uniref:Amino acid ABC transporter permease n=2 Tax=Clostridium sporogenes TaxID=1509 RepID=A0A7X5PB04_CLOSG|nr:amino acid ABC transporter permease [Clostridium sporogenes]AJD32766.1 putative amino-acid permease protein yxeN [Clostridium botulinum Prevot_594]KOY65044.1 ABC transporter permease [Clostridium sporogenes]KRU45592.1 amino acid ABC transporter permease [Clostridium sporogenes]MBY7016603.1 amino acid ABC transporter permease [Clostridium sporogenes]MBY7064264.1 amino acid ABC transporter permease [Clostridium sporogenes]
MNFDFQWFVNLFPIVLPALGLTIKISLVSLIFTLILSIIISIIRYYKIYGLYQIFGLYITFFRATPLVAQLFILYFGFPCIIPALKSMTAFQATVIALTLNTASFMAETLRASLESVDVGQLEACYSIGMTRYQTMMRVVLPQAFGVALPSIGNQFIGIIKGSALGFTVGLADIMAKAKMEAALSIRFFEAYLCVTLIYLVIVIFVEKIQRLLEKRIEKFC